MLALELAVGAAALAAGLAGAWSPCGFSAVETIGAAGRGATLAASCFAFALGALAGGAATFAGLAAVGSLTGAEAAAGLGAAVALAAALAEAKGLAIVPQVRRQVPEPWRRVLPLPAAAGAYGALLGLGFATFVLSLAFWALAAVTVVLANPRVGLVAGLAFGAGRALPVVVLAPVAARRVGRELVDVMAMRPGVLRGVRLVAAVALAAVAAAVLSEAASALSVVARPAVDPAATPGALAWDAPGGARLRYVYDPGGRGHHLGALTSPLPGTDPALGGGLLAWREGARVMVVRLADFAPVLELSVPGVDALAVSGRWLAYRARGFDGRDRLAVRSLSPPHAERIVTVAGLRSSLGRPALNGDTLVFHSARPQESRLVAADLLRRSARVVRRSAVAGLINPSLSGDRLLYVRQTATAQELVLGPPARPRRDRVLLRLGSTASRDSGFEPGFSPVTRTPRARPPVAVMLWTTALGEREAFVTLLSLRGGLGRSRVVRVPR